MLSGSRSRAVVCSSQFLRQRFGHPCVPSSCLSQAQTYRKMNNYYEAKARANGQMLLRVNMDEQSVGLVQKPLRRSGAASWQAYEKTRAIEDACFTIVPTHQSHVRGLCQ